MPKPVIPDKDNDEVISSAQKDAFLYNMEAQFDAFIGNVQASGYYSDLADSLCRMLEGLLRCFGPYLVGTQEKPGGRNPNDVNGGKGFKDKMSKNLSDMLTETNIEKAWIAMDVETFYCPSTRTWVKNPADCPDLDE